jgi:hypothetical protein
VKLRAYLTFEADFPNDAEFAESGDIKRPGGLMIAQVLCKVFQRRTMIVSEPEQHSFYGWSFVVGDGGSTIWFLLQFPGPWLLLSQNRTSLRERIFSPRSSSKHRTVLEILNESLAKDKRFREMKWYTKQQYESGGDRFAAKITP